MTIACLIRNTFVSAARRENLPMESLMMLAFFLPLPPPPPSPTAIDAERAFAADAQQRGQWTAFRATATEEAVMFVPQPVNAQAFLKDEGPAEPL